MSNIYISCDFKPPDFANLQTKCILGVQIYLANIETRTSTNQQNKSFLRTREQGIKRISPNRHLMANKTTLAHQISPTENVGFSKTINLIEFLFLM